MRRNFLKSINLANHYYVNGNYKKAYNEYFFIFLKTIEKKYVPFSEKDVICFYKSSLLSNNSLKSIDILFHFLKYYKNSFLINREILKHYGNGFWLKGIKEIIGFILNKKNIKKKKNYYFLFFIY